MALEDLDYGEINIKGYESPILLLYKLYICIMIIMKGKLDVLCDSACFSYMYTQYTYIIKEIKLCS